MQATISRNAILFIPKDPTRVFARSDIKSLDRSTVDEVCRFFSPDGRGMILDHETGELCLVDWNLAEMRQKAGWDKEREEAFARLKSILRAQEILGELSE